MATCFDFLGYAVLNRLFILRLLLVLLFGGPANAQTAGDDQHRRNQGVFVELFGSGGFYSINYDRLMTGHLGFRVGFGIFDGLWSSPRINFIGVPVLLNYLVRLNDSHCLELGMGVTLMQWSMISETSDDDFLMAEEIVVAYRYHPKGKRFFLRVAAIPFRTVNELDEFDGPGYGRRSSSLGLWGGLSLGFAF